MRPPWILGSQSWFGSLFLKYINKRSQVPAYGKGDNWMSNIDLNDCAGLILRYIESGKTNCIFNISNPNGLIKMKHFVKLIQEETGLRIKNYTKREISSKHGKATAEAFTFSLRSSSIHKELMSAYEFKYLDPKSILKNNLITPG